MRRRRSAVLTLLLALPLAVIPHGSRSAAQPDEVGGAAAVPVAHVSLAGIDPFVVSGTEAAWAVLVERDALPAGAPWQRVEVVAELHGALGNRSALRAALAGGAVPGVLAREVVVSAAQPIRPGGVVRVAGTVALTGPALSGPGSGIHPLRLQVLVDGQAVGRIDTAVVRVGSDPTTRLATTLVWPLGAPPARDADGDPSDLLDPRTVAGGRLDTLLTAIGPALGAIRSGESRQEDDPPVTATFADGIALVAPAHLLEDLRLRGGDATTDPDGAEGAAGSVGPSTPTPAELRADQLVGRIRAAAEALPAGPVITPYADADVAALLASVPAVRPLAGRAILEGAQRLPSLVGRDPSPVMLLPEPVTPAMLDLLPVRTVIVPHAAIDGPDLALDVALGEPVRALRSPTGRVITALVGDPYLTLALGASRRTSPGDPLLAAHEAVVRTAMVHLEAPGRTGRTLVLLPPDDFDPDPRFAAELLERLALAPWLEPTGPVTLAATTGRVVEPARLRDAFPAALPGRLSTAIAATERDLALLVGALDADAMLGETVPVGDRTLTEASDELMRASSRAFAADVDGALALLAGVRRAVDAAFGSVTLDVTDVTLTDRDGIVPMTLGRDDGLPVRVRVEVTGPAALSWTEGRTREVGLTAGQERAIALPVRSGATGRFPVTVRVTDPSGERLLTSDVIGVRATALAGPALVLIASTVGILTVVGTFRQRRRGLALRTVPAAPGDGATEEVTR